MLVLHSANLQFLRDVKNVTDVKPYILNKMLVLDVKNVLYIPNISYIFKRCITFRRNVPDVIAVTFVTNVLHLLEMLGTFF